MDNNQSLEKRIRRKVLAKRIAIFVGIPAVAVAITSTLYYVEKNRKEENGNSFPGVDFQPQISSNTLL